MRPAFAKDYPSDQALDALVLAFGRGDFARVRCDAPELMRTSADLEVRDAARELLVRTTPDPLAIVFFALAAALLVFLSGYWWWQTRS